MKIVEEISVFSVGSFSRTTLWQDAQADVRDGIRKVVWPDGSRDFAIKPEKELNGVKPIGPACVGYLESRGWEKESLPRKVRKVLSGKDLDALLTRDGQAVALEWETGNISSSHRAINKLLLGFEKNAINGAILVVPSRRLYRYLTDRVGNVEELRPYFSMWKRHPVTENGALKVFVVEHDRESKRVGPIPKGPDGNARAARIRRETRERESGS